MGQAFADLMQFLGSNALALLLVVTLVWSVLTRLVMSPVAASKMALIAAPPVALAGWIVLAIGNGGGAIASREVVFWTAIVCAYGVGLALDLSKAERRIALPFAIATAVLMTLIVGGAWRGAGGFDTMSNLITGWGDRLVFFAAVGGSTLVVLRHATGARGASVSRLFAVLGFAAALMFLMAMHQRTYEILIIAVLAVHLVVPIILGSFDAGFGQDQEATSISRRPSYPGWAGTLGLIMPLYLFMWVHVGQEPALTNVDHIGLRAAAVLSLTLLVDLVVRPARFLGMSDLKLGLAPGVRVVFMFTLSSVVALGLFIQRVQDTNAL